MMLFTIVLTICLAHLLIRRSCAVRAAVITSQLTVSRKRRRKYRKQRQQGLPKQRPEQFRDGDEVQNKMSLILTILGLLIGAIGLVALYPRLSASPQAPFFEGDQVPSFAITNDGYFRLTDIRAVCYMKKLEGLGLTINNALTEIGSPAQNLLRPTETYTIPCATKRFIRAPAAAISNIDLAIVVSYRPWPLPFSRIRKFFRFVAQNDGTRLNWYKQAPENIDKDFDEALRQGHISFP